MKNILCIETSVDATFRHFVVQVPYSGAVVKFCKLWKDADGTAWIDLAGDGPRLIKMWERIEAMEKLPLPCHIDHVLCAYSS